MTKSLFAVMMGAVLLTGYFTANAATPLRLNLEKGKSYKIRDTSHKFFKQSVNGQQMSVEMLSANLLDIKSLDQKKDTLMVEIKFDSIVNKITSPGGKFEINYNLTAKSDDYIGLIRNRVCRFKVIAKISTAGKFIAFTNYRSFKDSVLSILEIVPDSKKARVEQQAESLIKESVLQSMVEPLFSYLPEKEVSRGDKWETSYVLASAEASFMMFNSLTLDNIENDQARISGSSQMESLPSNDLVAPGAPQMSTDIKGTSKLDFTVSLSTGLIVRSSDKGHAEGVVTSKNQDKEMKIDIALDYQSEIVGVE